MARLVAPQGATSAFAIHLAREGRLAWASTQIRMWADWNMGGWGVSRVGGGVGQCRGRAPRQRTDIVRLAPVQGCLRRVLAEIPVSRQSEGRR